MQLFADRHSREGAAAFLATWIAFSLTLPRQIGTGVLELAIGVCVAVPLTLLGFAATTRVRPRPARASPYRVALVVSALVCGVLHLPCVTFVGLMLVACDTAAGLVFGWLFWHWGLPSAIVSHVAAGLIIQYYGPAVLS